MLRKLVRILVLVGAAPLLVAVVACSSGARGSSDLTPGSPAASQASPAASPSPPRPTPTPSPLPTATATASPMPTTAPARSWLLSPMSHAYQTWNNCGPVSALMALSYYGVTISQPEAADALKTHSQDKNVSPEEMVSYLSSFGLEARSLVDGNLTTLKKLISAGVPVVLHHRLNLKEDYGHYTVARGYDEAQGVLIINDSYYGPGRRVAYSEFEQMWDYFNRRYLPVYRPQNRSLVNAILGPDADEPAMLRRALAASKARTAATPGNAYAWLNLGETEFLIGDNAAAVAAWEKAQSVGLPERIMWYVFWPATAYNALGKADVVLALTGEVLAQQPVSPELLFERGIAYRSLGDTVRARQALNQALVYDPGMAKARKALEELGRG